MDDDERGGSTRDNFFMEFRFERGLEKVSEANTRERGAVGKR